MARGYRYRRALTLIAGVVLLALGVWSAVALGAGNDEPGTSTVATTMTTATTSVTETKEVTETTGVTETTEATDTTTDTTETTGTTAASTTTSAASKVWLCHRTGSWKHPYHLIHISTHALQAHVKHGDVMPGANNSCPTTQPAEAKNHGHGNGRGANRGSGANDEQNEATETTDG
jgi:hypothetical protein